MNKSMMNTSMMNMNMINTSMRWRTRMMVKSRSDHCSVNIGEGVVVTGNYPEVNTVNM